MEPLRTLGGVSDPQHPSLQVTWLGHATVVLDLAGTRLVTDPLLRAHAGPLRRRGPAPRPEQWAGSDAVLLSHLHHDHAELASLRMLGDVPVLSAAPNAAWLRRRGLAGVSLGPDTADPGEWHRVGSVEVRQVEADHHARPMPHRPAAAHGHLLRAGDRRVHVVGDSDLTPTMARAAELAGGPLDLVVVPIHGWGPRLSDGHLDPVRAAQACAAVGARWVLPYHFGTLYPPLVPWFSDYLDRPLAEFAAALAEHAPDCRLAPVAGQAGARWAVPTADEEPGA